jgi:peptide deformylase
MQLAGTPGDGNWKETRRAISLRMALDGPRGAMSSLRFRSFYFMVHEIVLYGDPVLRERGKLVPEITPEVLALADDMIETMEAAEGIGLAAPQIGRSLQLAVVDVTGAEDACTYLKVDGVDTPLEALMPLRFVNPTLEFPSKAKGSLREGCLSFPEVRVEIKRPDAVRAKLTLLDGRTVVLETDGLLARAIQHECDHLFGILFIDRASPAQKIALKKKIQRMREEYQ